MPWSKSPNNISPKDEPQMPSFHGQPSAKSDDSLYPDKLPMPKNISGGTKNTVDKLDHVQEQDSSFEYFVKRCGPDSTDSSIRYAAYTNRIRTILSSAHRYVAYTSDIGESFRPVAHGNLIRTAYGVSWLYILGDVSYEGYKAYVHNGRMCNPSKELTTRQKKILGLEAKPQALATPGVMSPLEDYRTVMVQRAIFQSVASMGLPAFTIHSIVKYSGQAMKNMNNKVIKKWAPIGLGLAIVPFLPLLYDHPVEHAVERVFHKGFDLYGGKFYVGDSPTTGREKDLSQRPGCNEKKPRDEKG